MQDIAHFDPRPEWSTEAYYVLSYLQKTASEYLLFGDYEDALFNNSARDEFSVRRPCRSNCIVVSLGDAPVTSEPAERFLGYLSGESEPGDGMASAYPLTFEILGGTLRRSFPSEDARPEDDYVAAMTADQWRAGSPAFADMLALSLGRTSLKGAPPGELAQAAQSFDATQRVLALEALARAGARDDMKTILSTVENDPPRGGELHLRIAETALRLGYRAEAERWAERAHENSKDLSLAVGYRHSMQAARILLRLGQAARARSFFREALEGLTRRHDDVMAKASAEAFAIALRHPVFLPIALGSGIDKGAIMVAAKSLIRSIARKVARKILAA